MLQTLSYKLIVRDLGKVSETLRKLDSYLVRRCTALRRFTLDCDFRIPRSETDEQELESSLASSVSSGILRLTISRTRIPTETRGE